MQRPGLVRALAFIVVIFTGLLSAVALSLPVHAATAVWQPAQSTNWMWEISEPLNTGNASLMGTGVKGYNGSTSPTNDPLMYDIDAIINSASTVSKLHSLGKKAVCYIEVGTAGNYYSAGDEGTSPTYYAQFKAAGVLGKKLGGYPEYFLNINSANTVRIVEAMIQQQCADKGFDGVETDLDETFGNNEGSTGFTITQANEQTYLTALANYMHAHKLAWLIKNPDDTGSPSFVTAMQPLAQGVLTEQCNQYSTCNLLNVFLTAGKPVFNAEYSLATSRFCPADNAANINGVRFSEDLSGGRDACR